MCVLLSHSPVPRGAVECDLTFCGLLVMENRLKPQTTPTIKILHDAQIRTVMITGMVCDSAPYLAPSKTIGDNLFTGIAVSRMCKMVAPNHQLVVLKATPSQTGEGPPTLSYHLMDELTNQSNLCASTLNSGD